MGTDGAARRVVQLSASGGLFLIMHSACCTYKCRSQIAASKHRPRNPNFKQCTYTDIFAMSKMWQTFHECVVEFLGADRFFVAVHHVIKALRSGKSYLQGKSVTKTPSPRNR